MAFKYNPLTGTFDLVDSSAGDINDLQDQIDALDDRLDTVESDLSNKIDVIEKGAPNGVAPLDATSKIDSIYLPSYVDDVLEFSDLLNFPVLGESGIIYVALDTNLTYRWSGSTYIQISESPVLSVNTKVGAVVLDKTDIGLDQVDNTSDLDKPISNATQTALDLITDVNWTGDYDNGITYTVGDGVMYNGASFRMVSFIGAAGYAPPAYPANWVQVTDYVSPNDIGLGNVDNTSDLDKPISNDTQNALNDLSDSFNYQQVVYVDKSNSKVYTPDGSINKPYKSIEDMYSAITDASASKRYACIIAPGTYTENSSIRLKGWIDLVPFATDTVIIGVSGGATLKWSNNSPGRVFIRDIGISVGLEILNDNPTGTSGLVFDLDNVDAPSLLFRGRGGGVDYIQLRNDTRIETTCTIQSAATTIFDSTNIGNLIMNDVGCVTPDPYGSAITASFRSNYIGQIQITATNYDIYTDIWGTIIAGNLTIISNSPSYPCYFNYDAISYPLGSVSLSGSNFPQLIRTSSAQSIRYTPSTPANWSLPNPEEVQKALDDLAAKDVVIESDLNNKVDKAGDTMTGPLNMSAMSENIQFSVYGMNGTQGIEIRSNDDATRPTGNVKLTTGDASGSDAAGSIYLQGGANVDGNPGNILLTAGQSSGLGSDGVIVLDAKGVVYLNNNASGSIDAGSHRIQNVEDPISDQDAATRKWVDEMSAIDNVLFVSPNANSFIADGTLHRPYATIAAALAVAIDNNVIALLPGTYNEPTVIIPSSLSFLVIQGIASTSTIVTNGISYTPGASSIDLLIQKVNIGVLSLDASSALNGLVTLKQVITGYNRQDSNSNVFMITTESTCFSGVIKGGGNNFSECLMVVSLDIESGALVIFENTKFVGYLEVYGSAIVRLLDCELFGAPYFVNGSIDFGNTPTIEIDTASDYLGSLNGDFTKVLLAVIPLENLEAGAAVADQYIKFDGANWVPAYLDAYITNYTPNLNSDWLTVPAVVSEGLDELASRVTTLDGEIIATDTIFQDMKEPTGFVNRTDSEISFDNLTRIFTVQPTGASFSVYHLGVKTTISTPLSITIPDTSGNYYIFINNLGNLTYTTTFDLALISEYAYCAYIYWDDVDNKAVIFGDERHGITMDGTTHAYLHTTRGTQLVSGAAIGYTLGSGALDADAQISLGDMQIKDEDITVNINNDATPDAPFEQILFPIAEIPIVYREGAIWKKSVATQFPMIVQSGDVRASYNEYTGSTWQLTEAPSNNKTLVTYIFATTSVDEPVIGILGQTQYNNIDEARGAASWENISFGDLPSPEMKLLYTLYYDTSSGYANAAKSKITYVADLRFTHDREVSAAVFNSDHANLSGLGNDDHTQYHTDARGDARYNLKSLGDISETNFSILNNQSSAQPITGFSFSNSVVRGFTALVTVEIDATSDLYEQFTLNGIQKASGWNMSVESVGDNTGVVFSISSLGQVVYTSSNLSGFNTGIIKFRALTTSF